MHRARVRVPGKPRSAARWQQARGLTALRAERELVVCWAFGYCSPAMDGNARWSKAGGVRKLASMTPPKVLPWRSWDAGGGGAAFR